MRDSHPVILGRDAELAVLAAAADAAGAGHGAFVLVEGPAGIGKTTLLRMACARPAAPGPRILTARGLALESGFAYGIARQLIEPVRAAAGPGEWDELLDGAAGLAARVFDWADAGSVEDDVPYATTHGLYWLVANLAGAPAAGDRGGRRTLGRRAVAAVARRTSRPASTACRSPCCSPCAAARTSRGYSRSCGPARNARCCRSGRSAARRPPRSCGSGSAGRRTRSCAGPATTTPAGTRSCSSRWPPRCASRAAATRWRGWKAWRRSRSPGPCCGGSASSARAPDG